MFASKARPSISGQGGNAALYSVAAGLVIGFGLDDADAYEILCDYNGRSCSPAWPESELRRTLKNARRAAEKDPGAVGEMARQDGDGFVPQSPAPMRRGGERSPANTRPAKAGQPRPVGGAPPPAKPAPDKARTPRTPVFNVQPHGGGAGAATARTVRTLQIHPRPYKETETKPDIEESGKAASVMSSDLIEPKAPSIRPQKRPALESNPNVTIVWNDTGEVIRAGRTIGSIYRKRGGSDGM